MNKLKSNTVKGKENKTTTSTQTAAQKLETRNKARLAFIEMQENRQDEIEIEKAKRKSAKKAGNSVMLLSDNILLLIYLKGSAGMLVSEMLESKPLINKKSKFSDDTLKRDYNVETAVQYAQNYYHEKKQLDIYFGVEFTENKSKVLNAKNNNRITLQEFCFEEVENYFHKNYDKKFGENVVTEMLNGNLAVCIEFSLKLTEKETV